MRRTLPSLIAVFAMIALVAAVNVAGAAAGESCRDLRSRLVRGGGSSSGLLVVDSESGQVLCKRAAQTQRPLASNMKMFTTATALGRFGPDTRIPTRVLASGTLDSRGVLHGDLYLEGGGDPALGTPAFYGRFLGGFGTNLFALKAQLRAAGLTAVTGRLYADDTIFDRRRGVADSGYATSPYIGPISGLAFNSGYSSSSGSSFSADPAKGAASKLVRSLRGAGISISSQVALGAAPESSEVLAIVRSPTVAELADATNVPSNNFYAETLIKLIGAEFGSGGSTRAGAAVVEEFARGHDSAVHAVDGSGLTRSNHASPAQVVRFLQSVRADAIGEDFIQSLALTGREGTVATRMDGTAAEARCRTKTGTLTGVSNLSGYCFNRNGRILTFSILMGSVGSLSLAHYEQDRIAAAIAGY